MAISVSLGLWKPHVQAAVQELNSLYPTTSLGTYIGHDPDRSLAVDLMIPGYKTAVGKALGWAVAKWIWENRVRLGVWYVIFDAKIISRTPGRGTWRTYTPTAAAVRASRDSAYHYNHVHVSFYQSAPFVTFLPPFYVDPEKVSTTLIGNAPAGKQNRQLAPGAAITNAVRVDGNWVVDADGYRYHKDYLTTVKPAGVEPPVVVPPKPVLPTYTVQRGDTLARIAARIGTNWQSLAALNPGINPDRIDVGQVITVPKTVPPVKPTPKPEPEPAVGHEITGVDANFLRRTDPNSDRKEWHERIGNAIKHIQSVNPDYVLGQELDSVTAADVAKRLGSVWWYQRLKGIGVFWRSDVFDFTEGRNIQHYFSTRDNRYFFAVPVKHKKSGETIWLSTSHLENDGDPETNGEAVRKVQATEIAAKAKGSGKWILGADFNSTTRSNGTNPVKPRVILHKAGWKFLTDQTGVANRDYASHHGGLSKTPKGPWIDDLAWKGLTYVDGSLIRTDGTDSSDHHFLAVTLKI